MNPVYKQLYDQLIQHIPFIKDHYDKQDILKQLELAFHPLEVNELLNLDDLEVYQEIFWAIEPHMINTNFKHLLDLVDNKHVRFLDYENYKLFVNIIFYLGFRNVFNIDMGKDYVLQIGREIFEREDLEPVYMLIDTTRKTFEFSDLPEFFYNYLDDFGLEAGLIDIENDGYMDEDAEFVHSMINHIIPFDDIADKTRQIVNNVGWEITDYDY